MGKADMHGSSEREGKKWGEGKHANMPTEVKMDMYPKAVEYGGDYEDDTMSRVDMENKQARSKSHSHKSNQH
jgi:hypothetical protein